MVCFSKSKRSGLPALSLALLALMSLVSAQMFADLTYGMKGPQGNKYINNGDDHESAVDQLDQNSSIWDLLAAH